MDVNITEVDVLNFKIASFDCPELSDFFVHCAYVFFVFLFILTVSAVAFVVSYYRFNSTKPVLSAYTQHT